MSDITTAEVAAGGGGFAAAFVGIQWVINFMTGRHDKRAAELDRREAELEKKVAARLSSLEDAVQQLSDDQRRARLAIGILVAKVARDDPHAPELAQVSQILGDAFPLSFTLPADLQRSLDKLG